MFHLHFSTLHFSHLRCILTTEESQLGRGGTRTLAASRDGKVPRLDAKHTDLVFIESTVCIIRCVCKFCVHIFACLERERERVCV